MDPSKPLDLRAVIKEQSQSSRLAGCFFFLVVPAILWGIARLLGYVAVRDIPTLIWLPMLISMVVGILLFFLADKPDIEKLEALRWPEIGTPEQVVQNIEDDWNKTPAEAKFKSDDVYLTPNWLLYVAVGVDLLYLRSVAWAYFSSVAHSVNHVPTGTTRTILIYRTNSPDPLAVAVDSEKEADEILTELQKRAPWAFYGFKEEYLNAWNKERGRFIHTVRQRYGQLQQTQGSSPSAETVTVNGNGALYDLSSEEA